MIISTLVYLIIFVICLFSLISVIYIDVYNILKLKDTETSVDMVRFEKCILSYER